MEVSNFSGSAQNCDQLEISSFLVAMLATWDLESFLPLKQKVWDCREQFPPFAKELALVKEQKLLGRLSEEGLAQIVSPSQFPMVLHFYRQWWARHYNVTLFMQALNKNPVIQDQINPQFNVFWQTLLKIKNASAIGKIKYLANEITPLINLDPQLLAYGLSPVDFANQQEKVNYLRALHQIFGQLSQVKDQKLLRDLLLVLQRNYADVDAQEFAHLWNINLDPSFGLVKSIVKSMVDGPQHYGLWAPSLEAMGEEELLSQFINRTVAWYGSHFSHNDFWIFTHSSKKIPVTDPLVKSYFLRLLSENLQQQNNYASHLRLQMIKDESWKELVLAHDRGESAAIFQMEYRFYQQLLEEGVNSHYAIFQLMKLGVNSDNLYWRLVF